MGKTILSDSQTWHGTSLKMEILVGKSAINGGLNGNII